MGTPMLAGTSGGNFPTGPLGPDPTEAWGPDLGSATRLVAGLSEALQGGLARLRRAGLKGLGATRCMKPDGTETIIWDPEGSRIVYRRRAGALVCEAGWSVLPTRARLSGHILIDVRLGPAVLSEDGERWSWPKRHLIVVDLPGGHWWDRSSVEWTSEKIPILPSWQDLPVGHPVAPLDGRRRRFSIYPSHARRVLRKRGEALAAGGRLGLLPTTHLRIAPDQDPPAAIRLALVLVLIEQKLLPASDETRRWTVELLDALCADRDPAAEVSRLRAMREGFLPSGTERALREYVKAKQAKRGGSVRLRYSGDLSALEEKQERQRTGSHGDARAAFGGEDGR